MARSLPSTAALEAFVAAARTLSFKRAARELHLSPAALGRRIAGLEDELGVRLFWRDNPGLALTPAGRAYLREVAPLLERLRQASSRIARPAPPGALRLSCPPTFAAAWLARHLEAFESETGIACELTSTPRIVDFDAEPVDASIRFGGGDWPGLHAEPLLDLQLLPVCSPLWMARTGLSRVEDLLDGTLIHVSWLSGMWESWLAARGLSAPETTRALTFDLVSIALGAAESGRGVALVSTLCSAGSLEQGRLVAPFEARLSSARTYHLVCPPDRLDDPRIGQLRDWLVTELAGSARSAELRVH